MAAWIAFPFSRGLSQLRNRTQVSCIAGGFFTSWATGEAHNIGDAEREMLRVASQEPDPLNNSIFAQGSLWDTVPWWQRG